MKSTQTGPDNIRERCKQEEGSQPGFREEAGQEDARTQRVGRMTEAERVARREETIEYVIQDIMKNRGVSREEAEEIFNRPF